MLKLQHEWDITAFIQELMNSGVEIRMDLELGDNAMSFELAFRDRDADLILVAELTEKHFKGYTF